jgi:hypothetical protein
MFKRILGFFIGFVAYCSIDIFIILETFLNVVYLIELFGSDFKATKALDNKEYLWKVSAQLYSL